MIFKKELKSALSSRNQMRIPSQKRNQIDGDSDRRRWTEESKVVEVRHFR